MQTTIKVVDATECEIAWLLGGHVPRRTCADMVIYLSLEERFSAGTLHVGFCIGRDALAGAPHLATHRFFWLCFF
jgi:hypothetical protein